MKKKIQSVVVKKVHGSFPKKEKKNMTKTPRASLQRFWESVLFSVRMVSLAFYRQIELWFLRPPKKKLQTKVVYLIFVDWNIEKKKKKW